MAFSFMLHLLVGLTGTRRYTVPVQPACQPRVQAAPAPGCALQLGCWL